MAINAGVIIPSNQPQLGYSTLNGSWTGVTIQINYITGQNSSSNPPTVGDIMVDQIPVVWEITSTGGSLSNNKFLVDVLCISQQPSVQVVPLANTQRGLICTPNSQGFIYPYWNGTIVELSPFREAMNYNFNLNPKLGNLGSGGTTGLAGIPKARAIANSPPAYINSGDVYIVGTNPSGLWSGKAEKIATYGGGVWTYTTPQQGDIFWVENSNNYYYYSHLGNWDVFEGGGSGGSGATNFVQLNDTPSSYSGKSGYLLRVNDYGSSIEFADPSNFSTGGGDTGGGDTGGGDTGGDGGGGSGITFSAENITSGSGETLPVKVKTGDVDNPLVASSEDHFLMVGSDGYLYACGINSSGQFGLGNNQTTSDYIPFFNAFSNTPSTVVNWKKFNHNGITYKKLYARYNSSACIDNNDVLYVWGENLNKKLGSNTIPFLTLPEKIDTPVGVKKFEIGIKHSFYLGTDNHVYQTNGDGGFEKITTFQVKDFCIVEYIIYFVHTDGTVYFKKQNSYDSNRADLDRTIRLVTTENNFYVKNIFGSSKKHAFYNNQTPIQQPATAGVSMRGITEYGTVYEINTVSAFSDQHIDTSWTEDNINAAGNIGVRQIHAQAMISDRIFEFAVTNDNYFIGKWGSMSFKQDRESIYDVNYIVVNPATCYIVHNDGTIRTHPEFKSTAFNILRMSDLTTVA